MKLPPKVKAAIKRYFDNRNVMRFHGQPWDKKADLDNLMAILMKTKGFGNLQAVAGTFWISWKNGIQTTHSEKNYWTCKVLSRRNKKGIFVSVDKEWRKREQANKIGPYFA